MLLETHLPWTIDSRQFGLHNFRHGARGHRCRTAEHHEYRTPRLKMQRHRCVSIRDLVSYSFGLACFGMPQLRGLADYAKTCIHRLIAVIDRKSTRLNSSHANISYAV